MMRRALIWLVIALAPMLSQAAAPSCLPANVGGSGTAWVGNVNQAGMWVGWWCSRTEVYVAACTRSACLGQWAAHRLIALWLQSPSTDDLAFGADPYSDPKLRAVWVPDAAMLDAVRPK